ncbi:MAG TPA: type II toxin-antitoxin system HicB family antitoxin [Candidatus Competibacteraceae bacterium]|nr:type II toxin-antitoxin system HicB family antitoxin [Candidatus Competibacteraceae bacterium]HRZ06167.1 type II toxin-antitoxin system HicB family antitoxin [Candidatus Competibacteraceae bacterium]HSA46151.1 type II toxin-antitoxin system HicB family antitoxin [Candidatus Competibacteraceae bacterium]
MLIYPVELTPDDNDTLLVTFPDVPEAVTFGEDEAEALLMAEDALLVMLSAYMDDRQPIPEPSPLNRRPGVALKVTASAKIVLYNALLAAGKRKTDLAQMLNLTAIQVDHLLSLHHKSRIEQIETALAALGKRLIVEMREAA